uniref:U6 snRNA-associated Sm-like protein LSm4 n=1 Tax=Haplochromis burtoni TaxID=8153 RepID=A0A3Q3BVR7_HAPBU
MNAPRHTGRQRVKVGGKIVLASKTLKEKKRNNQETIKMLPLSLLKTAQNHPMLVELKNGETYNGHLVSCDNWMNINLREVICTSRDGDKFWRMPECYIRGSTIKYLRIPDEIIDMVKEEVVSKGRGRGGAQQNKQQGKGRGAGGRGERKQLLLYVLDVNMGEYRVLFPHFCQFFPECS